MPRPNKPWFRKQTGWWVVKIDGQLQKLAKGKKNRKDALRNFHERMSVRVEAAESPHARVADICEDFLEFPYRRHASDTYRNHRFYIQSFCEVAGQLLAAELRPFHVTRWTDTRSWNETSQYNARRFVHLTGLLRKVFSAKTHSTE